MTLDLQDGAESNRMGESYPDEPSVPLRMDSDDDRFASDVDARLSDGTRSTPPPARKSRWLSRTLKILVLVALLAVAAIFAMPLWNYLRSYESTDDAQIDGHITPVSSRVDGTVEKVYVQDTEWVDAGRPLLEIDQRDYQVAVNNARANLAQAQALVNSARADYEVAQSRMRQEDATNSKAQADAARYENLYGQEVASKAEYDEAVRAAAVAQAALESDRASITA